MTHKINPDAPTKIEGSAVQGVDRRNFVKAAAAVGATGSIAGLAMPVWGAAPAGDRLKVGLVGCGGRGTGAANQAINADPGVMLWAMGDVYEDRLKNSYNGLKNQHGTRVMVDQERQFVGFDAIDKVLETGVDVVILSTPPGFRPDHLEKAVAAKKHVFCEKPMATDMPGLRRVMESAKKAKSQGTQLMSGFCWRYSMPERAMYGEINDGALGEIESIHSTYHTGPLGTRARTPEMTDMDFELRNWQHQNWLSGDIIVELLGKGRHVNPAPRIRRDRIDRKSAHGRCSRICSMGRIWHQDAPARGRPAFPIIQRRADRHHTTQLSMRSRARRHRNGRHPGQLLQPVGHAINQFQRPLNR